MHCEHPRPRTRWRGVPPLRSTCTAALVFIAVGLGGGLADAQYQPGDLIVAPGVFTGGSSGRYHLLGITTTGRAYTIQAPMFSPVGALIPAPDNRSIWFSGGVGLPGGGVYQLAPDGRFTTIAAPLVNVRLIDADGRGGALAHQERAGIVRISRFGVMNTVGRASSLIYWGYQGMALDDSTGDVVMDGNRATIRIATDGKGGLTTIAVKSPHAPVLRGQMAYDPVTDRILGADGGGPGSASLLAIRIRSPSAVVTVATFGASPAYTEMCSAVDVLPASRLAVLPFGAQSTHPRIVLFDLRTSTVVGTILHGSSPGFLLNPLRVVRAGSRHLSGLTQGGPGGTTDLLVSFPAEPGGTYVVGFSFGLRPGIRLGDGRVISLRPDALLTLSLTTTGIFSGTRGALNTRGEAVARVAIPPSQSLSGRRFFAVAVTLAGGQVRSISDSIGVTIP